MNLELFLQPFSEPECKGARLRAFTTGVFLPGICCSRMSHGHFLLSIELLAPRAVLPLQNLISHPVTSLSVLSLTAGTRAAVLTPFGLLRFQAPTVDCGPEIVHGKFQKTIHKFWIARHVKECDEISQPPPLSHPRRQSPLCPAQPHYTHFPSVSHLVAISVVRSTAVELVFKSLLFYWIRAPKHKSSSSGSSDVLQRSRKEFLEAKRWVQHNETLGETETTFTWIYYSTLL